MQSKKTMWGLETQMFRDTHTDSEACWNSLPDVNAPHIISQKPTLPSHGELKSAHAHKCLEFSNMSRISSTEKLYQNKTTDNFLFSFPLRTTLRKGLTNFFLSLFYNVLFIFIPYRIYMLHVDKGPHNKIKDVLWF